MRALLLCLLCAGASGCTHIPDLSVGADVKLPEHPEQMPVDVALKEIGVQVNVTAG